MFERLNEDEWDDEYTVKSLKEFLNSSHIDDDFPVRLGISEWNFSKSCNFYARQITSFGKPFVCLESMEINNDYNEIYDKWTDKKIENNKLKKENNELKEENEKLKQSIDDMGGRLQGLWANYNENRWGIWGQAVEDVAKELGFKIHTIYDVPISNSDSKKERINGVKKLNEIICENRQLKKKVKTLEDTIEGLTETIAHFMGDIV